MELALGCTGMRQDVILNNLNENSSSLSTKDKEIISSLIKQY